MKKKMFFHMIFASIVRRRSRMLVALLAIAVGAIILSGLVTIYYDVPRQMGAQFRNYGANMLLTPVEDKLTGAEIDEAVSVIPENALVGATSYRYETVRIHEQPILAAGAALQNAQKTSPYWAVDGDWATEEGQIMLGETVAEDLALSVGDKVEISYTPIDEETGKEADLDNYADFEVKGIISTGGSEEDYVYLQIADLETLTGISDSYDLTELSVAGGSEDINSYMEEINEAVPTLKASLIKRVTASETTVLSKLQSLVLLVTIVVLVLTMVCVATTMNAVVAERRKEIGLRKAIGASDSSIVKEFMGEGIILGAIGGLIGAILGFVFAQIVSINVFGSSISFMPLLLPITIVVSVIITGAACLIPIRSATKVDPALVLKGE